MTTPDPPRGELQFAKAERLLRERGVALENMTYDALADALAEIEASEAEPEHVHLSPTSADVGRRLAARAGHLLKARGDVGWDEYAAALRRAEAQATPAEHVSLEERIAALEAAEEFEERLASEQAKRREMLSLYADALLLRRGGSTTEDYLRALKDAERALGMTY